MGFRVWGLGAWGLGAWGLEFRVYRGSGLEFRVYRGVGFRAQGSYLSGDWGQGSSGLRDVGL